MLIFAIDPGTTESAYVVWGHESYWTKNGPLTDIESFDKQRNENILRLCYIHGKDRIIGGFAIEMVASYGQRAGRSIFETCYWIGRFVEAWCRGSAEIHAGQHKPWTFVYRRADVFKYLCPEGRPNDAAVRVAIGNRYGGDIRKAKGTKNNKGPLYGMKGDIFSALAVAITAKETKLLIDPLDAPL